MRPLPIAPNARAPEQPAWQPATGQLRLVLLGPVQQENLALQYLAAAARGAGHEPKVISFSYRSELDAALRETLAFEPQLVGLGIAFQNNIDDYLVLLRALRSAGFNGHLTCGGHVPTFCYRELLRDVPGLDSVVRHDGEQTLLEMLACLSRGQPPRDLPGLVWRDGDEICVGPVRPALADLDSIAWPERSPEVYTVGGIGVDFLITARGCIGECNYCSIAAYTAEQRKRYRLRKPEAVAEEIATIYHGRGARVMFIQDDLFVLPSEAKSVERCERLRAALETLGVEDAVFWVKGRPETITPTVADALRRMGAIHLFLGVESASEKRLGYLGRTHQPRHNESAIAACRESGLVASFNFMLFDPDCSLDDIDDTLKLAEQHLDLPWNVCRTEIYSGTSLRARLEQEGRLEGDYRSYGYRMADERAEILFRILRVSLHQRALEIESLLNRLISLSFARQLHERYFPGAATEQLANSANELGIETRRDTLQRIREALAFCHTRECRSTDNARRFAIQQALRINVADQGPRRRTEALWRHLHLRGQELMRQRGVQLPQASRAAWRTASGS